MELELLREDGFTEVQSFLEQIFGPTEPRKTTTELWRWKCTFPHPLQATNRGYIARKSGKIAAYASIVPLRFQTSSSTVMSAHVIDWAAARTAPGIGVRLYRRIRDLTGCTIGIGGSTDTRRLLPRIGAEERVPVQSFLRPARPISAALRGPRDWKTPARFVRDVARMCPPLTPAPAGLVCSRVDRFDASIEAVLPVPTRVAIIPERSVPLLNYLLACPAAMMGGYVLRMRDKVVGYFLISRVNHSARIADLWVRQDEEELWHPAFVEAFREASRLKGVWDVQAMTGHPDAIAALGAMRLQRLSNQLFLLDPGRSLPKDLPLAVSLVDYDGFYL